MIKMNTIFKQEFVILIHFIENDSKGKTSF